MKHHDLTDMSYVDTINEDGTYVITDTYDNSKMNLTPEQYEAAFGPTPSEKFFYMVDCKMDDICKQQYVATGEIIDLLLDVRVAYAALHERFEDTTKRWLDMLAEQNKSE